MNDPLKILDELESIRSHRRHQTVREICPNRCQALRTAIERQNERIDVLKFQTESLAQEALDKSEELAQMKHMTAQLYQAAGAYDMPERVLDVLSDMASGDPLRHKNILPVQSPETDEELAQSRARITRLEDALRNAISGFRKAAKDSPNDDGHYPHYWDSREALNETDRQSLAAVKAEALREARAIVAKSLEHVGDAWSEISPREAIDSVHDHMIAQIDNAIEREAKES